MFKLFTISLCILSSLSFAKDYKLAADTVVFPGRVSKMNRVARLVRIKIKFENSKFITKNNKIEIWNQSVPDKKCFGYLEARSNDYLLIRVPKMQRCLSTVYFAAGSYLHMYSADLENSLITAKELNDVLTRKRTALDARLSRYKREVDGYIEKVDLVNQRYEILRRKLELEWQKELSSVEEDKSRSYLNYQQTVSRLHELDFKMQQYRVRDQNMVEDRWSLDTKLYYKK